MRTVLVLLFINIALSVCGQEFNTHWIYARQADSLSHIRFRKAFVSKGRPHQASITVTTTGFFKLYVNECNVGTALFYPARSIGDSTATEMTFDITPYLRSDTNVVAILYSPTLPSKNHRQIAVSIYGKDYKDSTFCHISDDTWLCRRANSHMTNDGGEFIDGRDHDPSWKAATIYDLAQWLPANAYDEVNHRTDTYISNNNKSVSLLHNESQSLELTQNPVLIDSENSFYGFPRITLREAKYGEKIRMGNIEYICNGKIDEQAYPEFAINGWNVISIEGDKLFKPSQIVSIDLLSTIEQDIHSYPYFFK